MSPHAADAQLVTMYAGGACFGVPVTRVRDVLAATQIYAAPLAPPCILGSINLRGRIVTAIDLRMRLALPPAADRSASKCVIVEHSSGESYALLVDEIGDVMLLPTNLYEPNPITLRPNRYFPSVKPQMPNRSKLQAISISARFSWLIQR